MAVPNVPNWDVRLAQMLGVRPTPAVRTFLQSWARAEGGNAENNPFNTTEPGFGSIGSYNSVGVQRYGDPMQGLRATAATLKNGRYSNILQAMSAGQNPMQMAQALTASPWGTGSLVEKILGGGGGAAPPQQSPIPGAQSMAPVGLPKPPAPLQSSLASLVQNAAPSPLAVQLLAPLGGTAAKAAQAAQAPIPFPSQQNESAPSPGLSTPGQGALTGMPTVPLLPVKGATHGGSVPMTVGGNIAGMYPNLSVQGNVDWRHVNPRLLGILQKEAEKRGVTIVINSGYRSTPYNQQIGGAQNSNHRLGLAVDAYVNGHPIGDVIGPDEWAKLGVRSGNTPGFFKGQPDPEHLDLAGIPVKTGGR